jgi:UDPglucose--hexose-1-phosphate uridylyltransferase
MAEFRTDPLRGFTVLINGARGERPSEFQVSVQSDPSLVCPFCRGHEHMTPPSIYEERDSAGWTLRLVPNRFPALSRDAKSLVESSTLGEATPAIGEHEVLIETSTHDARAHDLSKTQWVSIMRIWQMRLKHHYAQDSNCYVHIFRNEGYRGGATLSHPHEQIAVLPFVPDQIARREHLLRAYRDREGKCLHCVWLAEESANGARVIRKSERAISMTQFAPRFPYEWVIHPADHTPFHELSHVRIEEVAQHLASGLKAVSRITRHPDSNIVLFAPPPEWGEFPWSLEVLPRVSTQAGFEWGTGIHIVSTLPEEAAALIIKSLPNGCVL